MFAEGLYTACQPAQTGRLLIDFPISRCGTARGMLWASGAESPFPGCCSPTEALSLVSGESGGFIHSPLVHSTCMDRASFIHGLPYKSLF